MRRFVFDTNLFFNMEPGLGIGGKTQEVLEHAVEGLNKLKGEVEVYMPPRIVDELTSFFDEPVPNYLLGFLSCVTIKSPDIAKIDFPASIFYQLISDIRTRSYRGLTIAEEEIKKAAQLSPATQSGKDFEIAVGPVVKTLRDRYRTATRVGFLDSLADLDLIVLARELEAELVSTDEGVIHWGRVFGVKECSAIAFGKLLAS